MAKIFVSLRYGKQMQFHQNVMNKLDIQKEMSIAISNGHSGRGLHDHISSAIHLFDIGLHDVMMSLNAQPRVVGHLTLGYDRPDIEIFEGTISKWCIARWRCNHIILVLQ